METSTYAILDENGVCIDRIVVDENFNPEEYKHAMLDDLNVSYTIEKETPGEEYFLNTEVAPHIEVVLGTDSQTDILSSLTDEQKEAANKAGSTISKRSEAEGNEDWKNWKEG